MGDGEYCLNPFFLQQFFGGGEMHECPFRRPEKNLNLRMFQRLVINIDEKINVLGTTDQQHQFQRLLAVGRRIASGVAIVYNPGSCNAKSRIQFSQGVF